MSPLSELRHLQRANEGAWPLLYVPPPPSAHPSSSSPQQYPSDLRERMNTGQQSAQQSMIEPAKRYSNILDALKQMNGEMLKNIRTDENTAAGGPCGGAAGGNAKFLRIGVPLGTELYPVKLPKVPGPAVPAWGEDASVARPPQMSAAPMLHIPHQHSAPPPLFHSASAPPQRAVYDSVLPFPLLRMQTADVVDRQEPQLYGAAAPSAPPQTEQMKQRRNQEELIDTAEETVTETSDSPEAHSSGYVYIVKHIYLQSGLKQ